MNEVMGVIAQLRDERHCKVALILNEDSLSETDKLEFQKYSEKVIDRTIMFLPTEAEATTIAFPESDPISMALRTNCERIGITNIRTMQKLQAIANDLMGIVKPVDDDIRDAAFKSLVILVWSALSSPSEGAPTLHYLRNSRVGQYFGSDKEEASEEETKWNVMLNDYGFSHCDELDNLMLSGIECGFFNNESVMAEIGKLTRNAEKIRHEAAIMAAWAPFHNNFDDNATEAGKSIYKGCVANIAYLTPINLNGAIKILKSTGHTEEAHELLKSFVQEHSSENIFELEENPFANYITDPDVVAAFSAKARALRSELPSLLEAATRIRTGSWRNVDEETLAKLSVDDFVTAFRVAKGIEKRELIFGCLAFRKISNASSSQLRTSNNAHAALVRISQESALNAQRVEIYGIKLLEA